MRILISVCIWLVGCGISVFLLQVCLHFLPLSIGVKGIISFVGGLVIGWFWVGIATKRYFR